MSRKNRLLLVEDNPEDAHLILRQLHRSGFEFDWERVETEPDFLAHLTPELDLILSDFEMPQFSGSRALELLKESKLDIPFIIVSGAIGEESAVEAMHQGASDYLLKDRIARLGPAVQRALKEVAERRERRRLEAQFIEAQKMEVVGQLASGVANDFNNVLAVIMGYSELIVQDLGPDHPLQKYAEEVRHAAMRASGLTQQLLIFSRKQTVQAAEIDLNEVIEGMEKMLRRLIDENVELSLVLPKDLGRIMADSGYIWQVLMNLVVNARDAMPNGGKIVVETANVSLDAAHAAQNPAVPPGEYVRLGVSDTGTGMSDEVKAHIFEAFFTTKPKGKGTGLGLVTCQNIVKQSDGYIDLETELGKGTRFRLYFPRLDSDKPLADVRSTQRLSLAKRGSETLLVVEDEPSLRQLAQGVLRAKGYDVIPAANGQDALRVAREHTGPPISLVITDVVMPRMGGKVMAEWLKTLHPNLKVLFTSGYTEDAIAHHGVLDKGVEFLPKPYTPDQLARKVRDLLDG